jgi:hypothetical protein
MTYSFSFIQSCSSYVNAHLYAHCSEKTYAEMSTEEKYNLSLKRKNLAQLLDFLASPMTS